MTSMFPIVAVIAALLLLFLASQLWERYWRGGNVEQIRELIPVDLEAFENLVDPGEEHFLRMNLSSPDFRRVQRSRLRAAKLYVATLSQNAAVLVAIGEASHSNADPELEAARQEIIQRAVRLKIWCFLSQLRMDAAFVFPSHLSPSTKIANQYMLVTYMAANLSSRATV